MKKISLSMFTMFSLFLYTSCTNANEEKPSEVSTKVEPPIITDDYIGTWVDIKDDNHKETVVKKYDNLYQIGGLKLKKDFTNDGRECLTARIDGSTSVQYIFDNHTQHLISQIVLTELNIVEKDREYRKLN